MTKKGIGRDNQRRRERKRRKERQKKKKKNDTGIKMTFSLVLNFEICLPRHC